MKFLSPPASVRLFLSVCPFCFRVCLPFMKFLSPPASVRLFLSVCPFCFRVSVSPLWSLSLLRRHEERNYLIT